MAVSALQQKCSTANVAPPGNPIDIVALASTVLDHLEASLMFAAQILSLTTHFIDGKARIEVFPNESTDVGQLRAKLDTSAASEAQAQAIKAETMSKLLRAKTLLETLCRDLELRGTRCTFLTNEVSSLRVDV